MTDNTATKTCPDCAEEVRAAARKCRFCGFVFPASEEVQPSPELPDAESSSVDVETVQCESRKPTPQRLGRMQARIILGLFVLLAVWIGYLFFQGPGSDALDAIKAPAIIVIAAVLIYGAWLMQEGQSKTKASQDAQIVCAQCHSKGCVTTSRVKLKKGISGGKATGAILTGGVSLLALGLSRKEDATEAKCSNCGSVWHF